MSNESKKTNRVRVLRQTAPSTRIICTMCATLFQPLGPRSKKTVWGLLLKRFRQSRFRNTVFVEPMINCGSSGCRGGQSVMKAAYVRFVRICVLVARKRPPRPRRRRGKRNTLPRGAFGTRAMEVSSMLILTSRLPSAEACAA